VLNWEAAYATAYTIEVSTDRQTWTEVAATTTGDGGIDDLATPGAAGRYVRLTGTVRAAPFGYSLFELEVHGEFTEPAVTLTASTVDIVEGGSATVAVRLNKPAEHDVTVRYATTDGSAVAGSDYTAASGTLRFPAGTVEHTVTLQTTDDPVDERTETFTLTLSQPTPDGTGVGPRGSATLRIVDKDTTPFDGATRTIDDFEGPLELFTFGGDTDDHPALTTVPAGARPGNALRVQYRINVFGGLVHNLATAQDWRDFDGIAFWFKGTGSGRDIQFEVKDGGTDGEHAELWETFLTDDSADWRLVRVAFADLVRRGSFQPPGAPTDGMLNRVSMWGWAMNLPQATRRVPARPGGGLRAGGDARLVRG
jgi:beta-glucosidase